MRIYIWFKLKIKMTVVDGLLQMTIFIALLGVMLPAANLQLITGVLAKAAAVEELPGVYPRYINKHNYGYVLKYEREINVATYDARLIFHMILPDWNTQFDFRPLDCRSHVNGSVAVICGRMYQDEEKRYQALEILYRHKSVFARDLSEIKKCKAEPLKLELHTHRKMFKRQYRLSEPDKVEMGKQIKQMEDAGVIERSSSSYYNSPTYLVLKKSGQKRMVVDLRGVNSLIIPKLVQLPQIEELLETVTAQKPRYFSSIDLLSAFYQLELHHESRDLTSFTGPDGRRHRYARAPMGLNNSPSALNLHLSNIFSDKSRFHSLACYVDDILLYTVHWDSHLQQLELALQTLEENQISCSPTKTEIGFAEIEYLGYRLSAEAVRISEKRIEAIHKIKAPTNVKALMRLLGCMNYFKRYVPDYSKNTYHMRQLLKKNVEFDWTPLCQKELDYLKGCLTSDPILKPINFNRDLVISCDASIYGIGYVIMQSDDDGLLHAVRYGSYATTPAQANYSAEDLEAVGLMYALKSIEWLAQSRHVTVLTDNTAVLHIADWTPRNRRQRRMLTYIMQFNLTVLYIRGSSNTLPDCLSRLFQDASPEERRDNEPKYMNDPDDDASDTTTGMSTGVGNHELSDPPVQLDNVADRCIRDGDTQPVVFPTVRRKMILVSD